MRQVIKSHATAAGRFSRNTAIHPRRRSYANGCGGPAGAAAGGSQTEDAEEPLLNETGEPSPRRNQVYVKMFESAATTLASIVVLG